MYQEKATSGILRTLNIIFLEVLMKKIIEKKRLYLRKLDIQDVDDLSKILSDSESMKYYPRPFSREEVIKWIEWNRDNYIQYNHGL